MEHSSRLYSGPLSQAAQKVLVALRAQSSHGAKRSRNHYNPSQIIKRYGRSGEPWTQSRRVNQEERRDRSTDRQSFQTYSQTQDCSLSSFPSSYWGSSFQRQTSATEGFYQCSQMYTHTNDCEPSAFQTKPALTFSEHEVSEMAASFSHGDGHTLSIPIPQTVHDGAAFWSIPRPAKTIKPSFNCSFLPHNGDPNEVLIPTIEKPNIHKEESTLACQTYSSCLEVSPDTNNGTSAAQKGKEWWNNPINEAEYSGALDSQLKLSLSDHNPSERVENGGLSNQTKSKIFRKTHLSSCDLLPRLVTGVDANPIRSGRPLEGRSVTELKVNSESVTGHMSCTEREMEPPKNGTVKVEMDRMLHAEKRPAIEMKGPLYLGLTENNNLKSISYLVTPRNRDKNSDCINGETEINECIVSARGAEHPSGSDNNVALAGHNSKILPSVISGEHKDQIGALVQCEPTAVDLLDPNNAEDRVDVREMRAKADIDIGTNDVMEAEQSQCSAVKATEKQDDYKKASDLHVGKKVQRETGNNGDEPVILADNENQSATTGREDCLTSRECRAKGSGIEALCLRTTSGRLVKQTVCGFVWNTALKTANGYIREGEPTCGRQNPSSEKDTSSAENKLSGNLKNKFPASPNTLRHADVVPLFPLKRKHEVLQDQNVNNFQWEPFLSSQENTWKGEVHKWTTAGAKISTPEHLTPACESELAVEVRTNPCVPQQTQQRTSKTNHRCLKPATSPFELTQCSMACGSYKQNNFEPEDANKSQTYQKETTTGKTQAQFTAGCLAPAVISDPRIRNSGKLNSDEKMQLLHEVLKAEALVLTMMYQDGTTQLDPEQKSTPVCGLLVLMKHDLDSSTLGSSRRAKDSVVFLKLEQTPKWAQQNAHDSQKLFTRDVLLQVFSRSQLVICYKAKDLLRTALQFYKEELNWKQVAGCHIQDPQVSGWLLDPADPSSCYQDLLNKHCKRTSFKIPVLGPKKVFSSLTSLYWLNKELCSKLQNQGLWDLYSDMEQNMIPVLAAMESHCIHVDKETLKRTSDLLGTKMKQLEQEAHRAAGQIFLITSNSQLRTVLFDKLRLHERCENKKLPKTSNKQQQSTCEATLLQLQHLHPLPKVILEYRQVHKIKSTFVDGILSCMMSKSYVSSSWYQTSAVTGRISSKQPNFQALPKQPLQITRKQSIQGKEEEVVTVHPRAVFIPQEGWSFLAADFCQVELRLLAHLSSDPELLRVFTNLQADVFTMLASQWKGIGEGEVTSEDRDHAKRIVYSVVYGAGCKRLSGILGVSAERATQFQDSFLQTYKEVEAFIHRTIQLCHKQGYVRSIMGRRRTLPNINSPDWAVRMQAERQAVNFVVQGSAADLCKMAMIRIFNLVSSSSALSARLVAQLHDELLYEVEDSQVEVFAALVKSTMESMQHIDRFGVHLKVKDWNLCLNSFRSTVVCLSQGEMQWVSHRTVDLGV
ncbi:uncharacterized protein LOC114851413 isoform X3 [Betta splendens]|uniref:DNA-directed DNA polymerase n=1 Tax=Betta splendens TaxID=158456 RepID=A0A9W2XC14_BETSP|nr:uncharacterized protein LOC114851413 isoform X3 [Betta splendens]